MMMPYEIEKPTNSLNPSTASDMMNTDSDARITIVKISLILKLKQLND